MIAKKTLLKHSFKGPKAKFRYSKHHFGVSVVECKSGITMVNSLRTQIRNDLI